MPKWLIPLVVVTWVGGGVSAYYGYWLPVILLGGLGILAATSAAGMLWANRGALRAAQTSIDNAPKRPAGESPGEATARRREETRRRQERNRQRRRRK